MIASLDVRHRAACAPRSTPATCVATELADYLVTKGVPFREAHDVAGHLVRVATERGRRARRRCRSTSCSAAHPAFDADVAEWLDPARAVDRRDVVGGPARGASSRRDRPHRARAGVRTTRHEVRSSTEYDELHCEDVALAQIAEEVGTPVYVYSRGELERAYRAFDAALDGHPARGLLRGQGELDARRARRARPARRGRRHRLGRRAVSAGCAPAAIRPKRRVLRRRQDRGRDEGRARRRHRLLQRRVGRGARSCSIASRAPRGKRAQISLRVNPDVDPETHPYISTGLKQNKFGVSMAEARELFARAAKLAGPRRRRRRLPHRLAADEDRRRSPTRSRAWSSSSSELASDGIQLEHVDIGGGLGIDYGKGDAPPPSPGRVRRRGARARSRRSPRSASSSLTEPGRVIVGHAGALVTRVLYRKRNEAKHFTIVDAAMNDLMRPALYGSYHPMQPVAGRGARRASSTDVVGPICETGDFFARDRELPVLEQGELLVDRRRRRVRRRRWRRTTTRGRAPPRSSSAAATTR